MSDEGPSKSKGPPGPPADHDNDSQSRHNQSSSRNAPSSRPNYMTVGNGSTSESAARLAALLDNDSGYGGSIPDGESTVAGSFLPGFHDTYAPRDSPLLSGAGTPAGDGERRIM